MVVDPRPPKPIGDAPVDDEEQSATEHILMSATSANVLVRKTRKNALVHIAQSLSQTYSSFNADDVHGLNKKQIATKLIDWVSSYTVRSRI